MSTSTAGNYEKKCCGGVIKGVRLNPRRYRFSVGRVRTNFLFICRVLRRWRNYYRTALKLIRRNMAATRRSKQTDVLYSSSSSSSSGHGIIRTMGHSNSFCSEAIADCLEFIKRNSVSVDDDRNPMLIK